MAHCSVGACRKPPRVAGMCDAHYQRKRKYGDALYEHALSCAHCGDGFRAWSAATKYCSPACGELARAIRKGFKCAGCSKPMAWNSKTSAPQGKARCRDCRQGGRGRYEYGDGRWATHGASAYARGCRCDVCREGQSAQSAKWTSKYAAERGESYSSSWRRKFKDEHGFWPQGSGTEFVDAPTRRAIYERDGWVCQLCEAPVDPGATAHAERASLDHIVPQSRGGSHDPSNLRMAHVGCNARRRDRVDDLEGVL